MAHPQRSDRGLRWVIAYKTIAGAVKLAAAATLAVGLRLGLVDSLQDEIAWAQARVSAGWSLFLADRLYTFVTWRHLVIAAVALALDGLLSSFEGWALRTHRLWASWLVVVTTGGLLPFEVRELLHHPTPLRGAVLGVNLAIVVVLVRRIRRERRA